MCIEDIDKTERENEKLTAIWSLLRNKLASSVDVIAISKIWKHYGLTHWLTQSEG